MRAFLQGTQAKRSVRGIINEKINRVTNKRVLTQMVVKRNEEVVITLGHG